ncbi:hypothetical protein M1L60_29345 [Actinoplanes sp. TRM 88003]|uniref:Secreted protein n=1 Tax=Paractinoplanes aksuensis TaxID=2939490 RepID=A0ABT1DV36_9ACTN|nr:hypothetical protein [Actinoplanes aksuensis]MCO8274709.1 hypothetical protein [Actinoplanes aksuensis]
MTQAGMSRHQRGVSGLTAILMVLLILAAGALVSAGSPHHHTADHHHGPARPDPATAHQKAEPAAATSSAHHTDNPGPVATTTGVPYRGVGLELGLQPADHEHHHGREWTPTGNKRLRPATDTAVVCVVPVRLVDSGRAAPTCLTTVPPASCEDPALIEVLQI